MMPTLHPSNNGFTLLEMMVVLTIVSLLALILASRIGAEPTGVSLAREEAKLVSAIHDARESALSAGKVVALNPASIVPGATVQGGLNGATDRIEFHADGSSSGGAIVLDGHPILTIDWLTGACRDVA